MLWLGYIKILLIPKRCHGFYGQIIIVWNVYLLLRLKPNLTQCQGSNWKLVRLLEKLSIHWVSTWYWPSKTANNGIAFNVHIICIMIIYNSTQSVWNEFA